MILNHADGDCVRAADEADGLFLCLARPPGSPWKFAHLRVLDCLCRVLLTAFSGCESTHWSNTEPTSQEPRSRRLSQPAAGQDTA